MGFDPTFPGGLAVGADFIGLAGGREFFCDPTHGSDANDGTQPNMAKATLKAAYDLTRDGYNDVVYFLGGATAYNPAVAFLWSNNYTHLIGVSNGLSGMGERCRIVNTAANSLTVLITFSGAGCLVKNMQFFDGKNTAADGACVLVSGARNHFVNCFFAGMGDATASGPFSRAGSYSLKVSGAENQFTDCVIGLDTIARTGANHELIVSGARNTFKKCELLSNSVTAGKFLVQIDSTADLREIIFEDCRFVNYSTNWATGITNAFDMSAVSSTVFVILQGNCIFVGVGLGVADTVTRIYGAGAAPNAGMYIATQPTT